MSRISLPLPLYVAWRYLKSTRRDAFITFLSATAMASVALGIAALILSLAALSGFQHVLRTEVLERTPHLEIELSPEVDSLAVMTTMTGLEGVESASLLVRGRGWLLAAGRIQAVDLVGFSGQLPDQFPGATGREPGVYVSDRLAASWGLQVGEPLEIVSPQPTLTPLGPQPRVRRLPLAGTFEAARSEQRERLAMEIAVASPLLGMDTARLRVTCTDLETAIDVARRAQAMLPAGTVVRSWRDLNRALLFALKLEKTLMFVAVFLIIVVAALALVSDLTLILASKQPEVGMLGAMGARPVVVRRIFLWLGALLVAAGGALGVILGVGVALILDRYRVLELPEQVYFLDHVPFLVQIQDVLVIVGSTVVLTMACSFVAADRAAKLRPMEALRR